MLVLVQSNIVILAGHLLPKGRVRLGDLEGPSQIKARCVDLGMSQVTEQGGVKLSLICWVFI